MAKEGHFKWGYYGEAVTYTNWSVGEPNNLEGLEHCVALNKNQIWNDCGCWIELYFICESEQPAATSTTTTTPTSTSTTYTTTAPDMEYPDEISH